MKKALEEDALTTRPTRIIRDSDSDRNVPGVDPSSCKHQKQPADPVIWFRDSDRNVPGWIHHPAHIRSSQLNW